MEDKNSDEVKNLIVNLKALKQEMKVDFCPAHPTAQGKERTVWLKSCSSLFSILPDLKASLKLARKIETM